MLLDLYSSTYQPILIHKICNVRYKEKKNKQGMGSYRTNSLDKYISFVKSPVEVIFFTIFNNENVSFFNNQLKSRHQIMLLNNFTIFVIEKVPATHWRKNLLDHP